MDKEMKIIYEFNGVIEYAHCFCFEIEAKNKKEAIKKANLEAENCINSDNAEFTKLKIDKPILKFLTNNK